MKFLFLFLSIWVLGQSPKVLVVTAHPDDETAMAATIFKISKEKQGIVDQLIITNGEGGYRYSLFGESIYGIKLTDEKIGRAHLPNIRKQELLNAGRIIGVRNHYFLDQKDKKFGLDEREPLDSTWNVKWVKERMDNLLSQNQYDFVFCLIPSDNTHAHHKSATLLALEAVKNASHKPIILGVNTSKGKESKALDTPKNTPYFQLKNYEITKISDIQHPLIIDRSKPLGFNNKLNYHIIVNWEIAEHKSQGTMQNHMNESDFEQFWWFDINPASEKERVKKFFTSLNESTYGK